jgi:hypothetical protein
MFSCVVAHRVGDTLYIPSEWRREGPELVCAKKKATVSVLIAMNNNTYPSIGTNFLHDSAPASGRL